MPERTTVTQVVQIGVESTPGTAVAADKRLKSFQVVIGIDADFTEIVPNGHKFPTGFVPGKESTHAKIACPGGISYDELPYLWSSVLNYAAAVQQGATTAYKWTNSSATTAEDTVKTYTVEQGSSVRAHKFAYGMITEVSLKGDRSKVELDGAMIGQLLSDGITLTSSPTVVPAAGNMVPLVPKNVSIYADDTSGGLGGTKLTRVLGWELSVKNRFAPLWVVDASNASWVVGIEQPIQAELKLKLEANSTAMALVTTNMRGGTSKFFRVEAISSTNAGTAYPYSMKFDFCGQVKSAPGDLDDADGVVPVELTFGAVHDETWGKALEVNTICKTSAL